MTSDQNTTNNPWDLVDYDALTDQQLVLIKNRIQKAQETREQELKIAVKNRNVTLLKKFLSKNNATTLSEKNWKLISLENITTKDIPFFNYICQLPQFEYFDRKDFNDTGNLYVGIITKQLILAAFSDYELFQHIKDQYSDKISILVAMAINDKNTPKEVIAALFEEKKIFYTEDNFIKALKNNGFAFVDYCLENNLVQLNPNSRLKVYVAAFYSAPDDIMFRIERLIPEGKNLNLEHILEQFPIPGESGLDLEEKYQRFIKQDLVKFGSILRQRQFGAVFMLKTLVQLGKLDKKEHLLSFLEICGQKNSDNLDFVQRHLNLIKNPTTQKIVEQVLFALKLEQSIPNHSHQSASIKI